MALNLSRFAWANMVPRVSVPAGNKVTSSYVRFPSIQQVLIRKPPQQVALLSAPSLRKRVILYTTCPYLDSLGGPPCALKRCVVIYYIPTYSYNRQVTCS